METVANVPVSFTLDGRTWHVGVEPLRWFERVDWWKTAERMPKDQFVRMDVMIWRVQARIGHNPRSELLTFDLVLGQDRETWTVRSMMAAA